MKKKELLQRGGFESRLFRRYSSKRCIVLVKNISTDHSECTRPRAAAASTPAGSSMKCFSARSVSFRPIPPALHCVLVSPRSLSCQGKIREAVLLQPAHFWELRTHRADAAARCWVRFNFISLSSMFVQWILQKKILVFFFYGKYFFIQKYLGRLKKIY